MLAHIGLKSQPTGEHSLQLNRKNFFRVIYQSQELFINSNQINFS